MLRAARRAMVLLVLLVVFRSGKGTGFSSRVFLRSRLPTWLHGQRLRVRMRWRSGACLACPGQQHREILYSQRL